MVQAHEVIDRVEAVSTYLAGQAEEAEALGRLPEATAKQILDTGIIRVLQPSNFGGYQADPRIFFEGVMKMASRCGASGWVAGIVGVHPWELALLSEQAQSDVWESDPDTWICSSYMPGGRARKVDGGYLMSGKWQFSSGSDHCDWAFLGGFVEESGSGAPTIYHFLIPKTDYRIIEESWKVVGLCGTGSNDLVMDETFVPAYRAIPSADVFNSSDRTDVAPLYRYPYAAVFPNAITGSIIGMAEGALECVLARQRLRAHPRNGNYADDPYTNESVGEAASEIAASRAQLMANLVEIQDLLTAGQPIPMSLRVRVRRDQVRGSWRAVSALDELFARSGGGGLRTVDNPLQRLWRDAHAGLNHTINVPGRPYHSFASEAMDRPIVEQLV